MRPSIRRIFWLLTCLFFVSGCSTYRAVPVPQVDSRPGPAAGTDTVEKGSRVRLLLQTGDSIQAVVSRVSDSSLTIYYLESNPSVDPLESPDKSSMVEETFLFSQIQSIEVRARKEMNWRTTTKVVVILAVLTGAGIAVGNWLQREFSGGMNIGVSW